MKVCGDPSLRALDARMRDAWSALDFAAPVAGATAALAIEDTDALVLAAATPLRPGSTWTPYVAFSAEGAAVRLVPMKGPAIVCSPVDAR